MLTDDGAIDIELIASFYSVISEHQALTSPKVFIDGDVAVPQGEFFKHFTGDDDAAKIYLVYFY